MNASQRRIEKRKIKHLIGKDVMTQVSNELRDGVIVNVYPCGQLQVKLKNGRNVYRKRQTVSIVEA